MVSEYSFSTTGKPISAASFDGFVFGRGNVRLDGRDAVGGEQFLGFEFGQDGAAGFADGFDQFSRPWRGRIRRSSASADGTGVS